MIPILALDSLKDWKAYINENFHTNNRKLTISNAQSKHPLESLMMTTPRRPRVRVGVRIGSPSYKDHPEDPGDELNVCSWSDWCRVSICSDFIEISTHKCLLRPNSVRRFSPFDFPRMMQCQGWVFGCLVMPINRYLLWIVCWQAGRI